MRVSSLWVVGIAIGAIFLWLSLRSIDLQAVISIARHGDPHDMLAIVVCAFAFVGVKAVRWSALLQHLRRLTARRLVGPVLAGIAVNYAIPHGGELLRAWMLSRRESLAAAAVLASVAVERLLDFCALLLLGGLSVIAGHAVLATLGAPLRMLLALALAILVAVVPFVFWSKSAVGVARLLLGKLPGRAGSWSLGGVERGIAGLASLQDGPTLLRVFGLSVVLWTLMAACAWLSLRAVGIDAGAIHAIVTVLLLVAGTTLPTAPAHFGTTQIAYLLAAAPFGVEPTEALAASFVYNVFVPVPLIVAGSIVLARNRSVPRD